MSPASLRTKNGPVLLERGCPVPFGGGDSKEVCEAITMTVTLF